jgi:hypothetical protein
MLRSRSRGLSVLGITLTILFVIAFSNMQVSARGIEVLLAEPPDAEQGTVNLDVAIHGAGFNRSSNARFFLTGTTNPAGITVNSTRYIDSTKLISNINVADGANPGGFDIEVTARGRTGKGIDLFSVRKKNDEITYVWKTLLIDDGGNVLGDCDPTELTSINVGNTEYYGCLYDGFGTETESHDFGDETCVFNFKVKDRRVGFQGLTMTCDDGTSDCLGLIQYLEEYLHPRHEDGYDSARFSFQTVGGCAELTGGNSADLASWSLGIYHDAYCGSFIRAHDNLPAGSPGTIESVGDDNNAWFIDVFRSDEVNLYVRDLKLVPKHPHKKKSPVTCEGTNRDEGELDFVSFRLLFVRTPVLQ